MNIYQPMDRMAINLFPSLNGNKWAMLVPKRVRGGLISIGPINYRIEFFHRMSQAVHRAFCMREKAKAYKDLPVILSMVGPPRITSKSTVDPAFVYRLDDEDDALFLILQYDQS
jgi:hypothetical protein